MPTTFIKQDLAASVDEEDVAKFTDAVKEFDSMTKLVCWVDYHMKVNYLNECVLGFRSHIHLLEL